MADRLTSWTARPGGSMVTILEFSIKPEQLLGLIKSPWYKEGLRRCYQFSRPIFEAENGEPLKTIIGYHILCQNVA